MQGARLRDSLRLFVAVYPPIDRARELLRALKSVALPPFRVVAPEQVHLTLQFIGDTPRREFDTVSESVERACAGLSAMTLEARRISSFPRKGESRLVAAVCEPNPILAEVQRRLVSRLARRVRPAGVFTAHLTLCRFIQPQHANWEMPLHPPVAFAVSKVCLVSSLLRPGGAVHRLEVEFSLGEGG